jgi:thiol-disulfide isomerase/thioredoxin
MERMRLFPWIVAALALTACSGGHAVDQSISGSNGYQTGDAALHWIAPSDRHRVDDVRGELLDGASFDLSRWRGDVVVVNFWESDCVPCRSEAKALNQVYEDNRQAGVRFLGVDVRDDRASALTFTRTHDVQYPSLFDEAGMTALRFPKLPPNATPTTLVLDRRGRIAARHSGEILYTQLRSVVDRVVSESA